jgi:hypothetical protein
VTDARVARVRRVIAAAARVADPADPLGREARRRLPATTGLSPEGVELALATGVERGASSAELQRLLGWAGEAPRAWVVASANVCTAAVRAIALATAASTEVRVRPSRRDPVVAELLVAALVDDALFAAAGGRLELADRLEPAPGDHVHAYGSDATMLALAASLPERVALRRHGTGMGVALVSAGADVELAADAIATDVAVFDQRGCLSPRVVLVEGDAARATVAAGALDAALARVARLVPRGALDDATAAELARWKATLQAIGEVTVAADHAVAMQPAGVAALAPAARALLVAPVAAGHGRAALDDVLGAMVPWIASLGVDDEAAPAAIDLRGRMPEARCSRLGRMQRPPLDGPVDLRSAEHRR